MKIGKNGKALYRRGRPILPAAAFEIGQDVNVPAAVCESGKARIAGVEWKSDRWQYWLIEVTPPDLSALWGEMAKKGMRLLVASSSAGGKLKGGTPWAASESELLKWAKG